MACEISHSNLRQLESEVTWLAGNEPALQDQEAHLLSNLDAPLLDQVMSLVTSPVRSVSVVSRYFDEKTTVLDALAAKTQAKKIRIYTQNSYTTLTSAWLNINW